MKTKVQQAKIDSDAINDKIKADNKRFYLLSKEKQIEFLESRLSEYPDGHTEKIYIKLQINRLKAVK